MKPDAADVLGRRRLACSAGKYGAGQNAVRRISDVFFSDPGGNGWAVQQLPPR